MAVKPMPEANPGDSAGVALASWLAPASPATPPARAMAIT